jgi:hypothetical protein
MKNDILSAVGRTVAVLAVGCTNKEEAALVGIFVCLFGGGFLYVAFCLLRRSARWFFEPTETEQNQSDESSSGESSLFGPITHAPPPSPSQAPGHFQSNKGSSSESSLFGSITHNPSPSASRAPGHFAGFIASSGGLCKVLNQRCEDEQRCRSNGCPYT